MTFQNHSSHGRIGGWKGKLTGANATTVHSSSADNEDITAFLHRVDKANVKCQMVV